MQDDVYRISHFYWVSHHPGLPYLVTVYCCGGSCFSSCDNPLSCLFGTVACGGSSQSRNGSSWRSSLLQSASLAWLRSVCTRLRIMGDYCCWPLPQATPTWWANWPRQQRGMGRPTWPFSPTSCREGEWKYRRGRGKGAMFESRFQSICSYFFCLFSLITTFLFLPRLDKCLDLLIETDRLPEAAFLARTYLPSHVSR